MPTPPTAADAQGRGTSRLGKLLLAVWGALTLLGIASLSVGHIAAMPEPDDEARLARAALQLRRDAGQAFIVHVISAGCSCTERLFTHLVERPRFAGAKEVMLFVGEDAEKQRLAEAAGVGFVTTSPEALAADYGIEAAPLLVAFDAAGRLRYAGGYYNHPSTLLPLDARIEAELAQGALPEPLPVFGCAVSSRLQKSLDPLGVVYPRG
jgi:hypothetical protein